MELSLFELRCAFGIVFLMAGVGKLLTLRAIPPAVMQLANGLISERSSRVVAVILPPLEIALGLCVLSGVWLRGALVASLGVLVVFTLAVIVSLMRGEVVSCNCFGVGGAKIGPGTFLRNLSLTLIVLALLFNANSVAPPTASLSIVDTTLIGFCVLAIIVTILVFSELNVLFEKR